MALTSALAVLVRPDALLLPAILLIDYLVKNKSLPSYKYLLLFLATLSPWVIFSLAYFGDLLPNTVAAKITQGSLKEHAYGYAFARHLPTALFIIPAYIYLEITLALIGLFQAFKKQDRFTLLLTIWGLSYVFVYALILNAPGYPWYFTPLVLVMAILITHSLEYLIQLFATLISKLRISPNLPTNILIIVFMTCAIAQISKLADESNSTISVKHNEYKAVANWLNQNATKNSSLASREIGVLGFYYKQGKIVDGLGLIDPKILKNLSKADKTWHIRHYQPNYVLTRYNPRKSERQFLQSEWFKKTYKAIKLPEAPNYLLFSKIN